MKSKEQQILEEAYEQVQQSTELPKDKTAQAVQFAIQAIDDILGEAGYEGLPEYKQENLYKAIEMLRSI